jgi:hypothetical protein
MEEIILEKITKDKLFREIKDLIVDELKKILKDNTQKNDNNDFITRKEVCQLLKIHESTLNRWKNDGKLKCHYIGNKVYYNKLEIYNILNHSN